MLRQEENELLCRVGPGTLLGNLFRQYWLPAILSSELRAPDSDPVRAMLLGEPLIAFRDTTGKVGLIQNNCPHRGASLFFGRNEESGLRCVYHGWKFDAAGNCVDMPNEPAESDFKQKVKAVAYPTHERNGIIWAYLGPRETPPPLPDLEANMHATNYISIIHRPCNWMQGWEGEMDTVHAAFLHNGADMPEDQTPGSFNYYQYKNRACKFVTVDTEYGTANGAYRPAEDDTYYWRVTQILMPFYNMIPTGELGKGVRIGIYVPTDDNNHLHWEIFIRNQDGTGFAPGNDGRQAYPGGSHPIPNGTGWHDRFRVEERLENDYLIDREAQRTWKTYTGIQSVRIQDCAVTETMGPIYDRSHEHLGTTDQLIIRTRRRMINAAKALREHGTIPPCVDEPQLYRQRSGEMILPRSVDWYTYYQDLRKNWMPEQAQVKTPAS